MKHNIIIFLSIFMYGIATISAQELNRDSVPPASTIITDPDEMPEYPGDYYALNAFLRQHLIFPADAWRAGEREPGALRFIIRADGVACGLQPSDMHPSLYRELKRVFALMPRWVPARKDGRPVNVDYTIPTAPIHLYDYWDTAMPYHVADAMQKIKRYTNENKDLRSGLTPEEAQTLCEQAEAIVHFTPENVAVASTLARLLMAQERQQEAIAVADTCTRRYQLKARVLTDSDYEGYPEEFGRLFKAMKAEGNYFTPGYDGRDNIHAALTYALVCSASGDDSLASQAYRQTQEVITDRMIYQDIRKPRQDHPNYMYQQLMNEKIRLALTSPGNTMGRSDMKDLMETYTYGDAMRVIDQKVKEGKINNARIQQIDTQMGDIEKKCDPYARLNNKDMLNLYGLYALTLYLSEGMDAQQQYMDSLSLQSKKLKSYFKKMSKKMEKHQAELSDREAVIRSLACLAPINQKDETPSERKQKAKEFFRYRDAVKDVYPLEWLWK